MPFLEREPENNMEKNSWERDESHAAFLGLIDEAGSGQAEVDRLYCRPRHDDDAFFFN